MRIHPLDLAIVVAYLLGVTALGVRFRRVQRTAATGDTTAVGREYFLGGRTAPWWALAFSIVATETSTLTIIGTPAISYAGNLTFIQLVFGYLIGRVLIVLLLLPGYFRGEFFTAYALIEKRFGEKMRAGRRLHLSHHARDCGRRPRFGDCSGRERRAGHFGKAGRAHRHCAHGSLHLRRRDEGRHLDGRGPVAALSDRKRGDVLGLAAPNSRRLERGDASGRRRGSQTSTAGFFLESGGEIHILVRTDRRRVSHHGQPRHGPNDRAAAAGREERA